jgi:transposase
VAGVSTRGLAWAARQAGSGTATRIVPAQRGKLVQLLVKGPLRAGYRTNLWTLARVTALIDREFGIRYHPGHVWKLLTSLGWSCQKPEQRAVERDEPPSPARSTPNGRG